MAKSRRYCHVDQKHRDSLSSFYMFSFQNQLQANSVPLRLFLFQSNTQECVFDDGGQYCCQIAVSFDFQFIEFKEYSSAISRMEE